MIEDMGIAVDLFTDLFGLDGVDMLEGEVLVDVGRTEVAYFFVFGETNAENLFD